MATGSGLGGPGYKSLEHALMIVEAAFGETPWLVGSATTDPDYRDVDIRVILKDERFNELFGHGVPYGFNPFWSLVTTAISEYLESRTELPIDFQIQRESDVDQSKLREQHRIPVSALKLYGFGRQVEEANG